MHLRERRLDDHLADYPFVFILSLLDTSFLHISAYYFPSLLYQYLVILYIILHQDHTCIAFLEFLLLNVENNPL